MPNLKDLLFFVSIILLLVCLAYTGWENISVTPRLCAGNLINSAPCQVQVARSEFFTVLALAGYLIFAVLLSYGNRRSRK